MEGQRAQQEECLRREHSDEPPDHSPLAVLGESSSSAPDESLSLPLICSQELDATLYGNRHGAASRLRLKAPRRDQTALEVVGGLQREALREGHGGEAGAQGCRSGSILRGICAAGFGAQCRNPGKGSEHPRLQPYTS